MTKIESENKPKRPLGRPILPEGSGKETVVSIRLTSDEREKYEKAAENKGISLSAWIRNRLAKTLPE
jgi:hypothetical protein